MKKFSLYPHQVKALELTADNNCVGYFLDMGLGKSYVSSEKMYDLGEILNLVICQKSKIDDWCEHFRRYYDYEVYDLTDKDELNQYLTSKAERVGVINYELFWRRPELFKLKDFTLICDESGLLTNDQAKRTKGVMKLNYSNILLLSGSVCGGKYENLWPQLHILGWGISKELFYNTYIDFHWDDRQGFPLRIIDGYKNVERLKRKLREKGCVFMKTEECVDLPEQVDQAIYVDVTKQYKHFVKDRIVAVKDKELVGDTTLTKLLYERQLCGQYNQDKLEAFKDLIESTSDRVIVFYNYNAELELLKGVCELVERPYSLVNGSDRDLYAYDNLEGSVTLIQYQAGAMGLNLQKANRIVYYTPTLSSELFEQSKKRIHRIGQSKTCFYYYLTCRSSVEERIYDVLAMRRDYTERLFEDEGEIFNSDK